MLKASSASGGMFVLNTLAVWLCPFRGLATRRAVLDVSVQGFRPRHYPCGRGMKWSQAKRLGQLKDRVRAQTARLDGRSWEHIVTGLNRSLRGWYGYFQHSQANTFATVEGMCAGGCGAGWKSSAAERDRGRVRCRSIGRRNVLPAAGGCPWQRNTSERGQP